ncbi:hypothetical protein AB3S75_018588 [Citrus x aurantiifolia]
MTGALNSDYQVCEQIGRGRFSIGFRCTSWISGKSFAFKSIDKNLISGDSLDSQCILTEPKILQLLNPHHKIVQIFAVYENQFHFDIMLEFCNSQDLYHRRHLLGISVKADHAAAVSVDFSHHKADVVQTQSETEEHREDIRLWIGAHHWRTKEIIFFYFK